MGHRVLADDGGLHVPYVGVLADVRPDHLLLAEEGRVASTSRHVGRCYTRVVRTALVLNTARRGGRVVTVPEWRRRQRQISD